MIELNKNVIKFYKSINSIDNHRYKSWEHCHKFFLRIKNQSLSNETLDLAQLHLAFYLASWGMYRGSSFILQKDYTIFNKIIKIILDKDYSMLWEVEEHLEEKEKMANSFETLYKNIEKEFRTIRLSVKQHPDLNTKSKRYLNKIENISPTLITKVILGTIGCIPAYDRYFIEGLKQNHIQQKFNPKKSFLELLKIYIENKEEIDSLRNQFKGYTLMKIIDMNFWIEGYEKIPEDQ